MSRCGRLGLSSSHMSTQKNTLPPQLDSRIQKISWVEVNTMKLLNCYCHEQNKLSLGKNKLLLSINTGLGSEK